MTTNEPCPECGMPAECEHGWIVNDRPCHTWHCRACGELTAVLGYTCADCERVNIAEKELSE
jgi:hypothetical protein